MIKIILLALILVINANSDELLTRKDGKRILIKNDFTWSFDSTTEETSQSEEKKTIKTVDDAVEVWDKSLSLTEVNYSDAVALYLHYLNKTNKRVIGISVYVAIKNAFGKIVFQNTYEDEVVIEPNEKLRNDTYWHFDNNPFIAGEPFDLMWQMAQNGTAQISTSIRKVIFDDGTILTSNSKKKK